MTLPIKTDMGTVVLKDYYVTNGGIVVTPTGIYVPIPGHIPRLYKEDLRVGEASLRRRA